MSTIQYRPSRRPNHTSSRAGILAAAAVAVLVVAGCVVGIAHSIYASAAPAGAQAATVAASAGKAKAAARKPKAKKRAVPRSSQSGTTVTSAGKSAGGATHKAVSAKRTVASAKKSAKRRIVATGPSLHAYAGLGSWVDLYDDKAWSDPGAAVNSMARHGVRTLYVETSNFHTGNDVEHASELGTFIERGHAKGMKVVAWYLPDLKSSSVDFTRVSKAIDFKSPSGQKFDSFALDIEATEVHSETARNAGLATLSRRIRAKVGRDYPLGAIIPSPVGLAKKAGYWDDFPYTAIAKTYDVFVPMAYYSYHAHGYSSVLSDALNNVKILRSQPGCSHVPIHLIGGISEDSSASEAQAFAKAVVDTNCFGGSLYGWVGTSSGEWSALKAIAR